jgi:tetratricopeptide (TPR) repeat protein
VKGTSRRRLLLATGALGLALAAAWAGVARVPPGRVGLLPDGGILPPGWHFGSAMFGFATLGPGPFEIRGSAEVASPEGSRLQVPYRLEIELGEDAIATLAAEPRAGSAEVRCRRAVEAALQEAAGSDAGSFALLRAGPGRRLALAALSAHPPLPGARVTDLRIGPAAAGRGHASPLADVILVGLDGADWLVIHPLMRAGKLPALERLVRSGASAHLRSAPPLLSPLLWTSVATGVPPDRHGVVDFTVWDPATRDRAPISSRARRVPALWNILTSHGLHSAWFGWWATWPAEPVAGLMASDRVAYTLFAAGDEGERAGAVYPPEAAPGLRALQTVAAKLPWRELHPFIRLEPSEVAGLERRPPPAAGADFEDRRDHLRQIVASTRTYFEQARWARDRLQPALLSVYFQGIDEVSHRFMHYARPTRAPLPPADVARYGGAVQAFYRYQDEVLGKLVEAAPGSGPAPVVMVISDHGFLSGAARPPRAADEFEGAAADWHRLHGVFILSGPGVRHADLGTVSLYDIFPTLLYLCGIPIPEGLPGRPLLEAFDASLTQAHPPTRTAALEAEFGPQEDAPAAAGAGPGGEEAMARLRALGYVGAAASRSPVAEPSGTSQPPAGGAALDLDNEFLTAHMNLGSLYGERGEWAPAAQEFRSVAERFPSHAPAFYKWMESEFRRGDPPSAWKAAERLLGLGSIPSSWLPFVAEVAVAAGEQARMQQELQKPLAGGAEASRLAALGILELRDGRAGEAEALFRRALEIEPLLPEPLEALQALHADPVSRARLVPILRRALERSPRSVYHLSTLAGILVGAGRCPEARPLLAAAIEEDPDSAPAHVSLAKCQALEGQVEEAAATLSRALDGSPRDLALLRALGALEAGRGNLRRGIDLLEEARSLAPADTAILNALGLARLQNGEPAEARDLLRRSLAADPSQPDVRALLDQIPG